MEPQDYRSRDPRRVRPRGQGHGHTSGHTLGRTVSHSTAHGSDHSSSYDSRSMEERPRHGLAFILNEGSTMRQADAADVEGWAPPRPHPSTTFASASARPRREATAPSAFPTVAVWEEETAESERGFVSSVAEGTTMRAVSTGTTTRSRTTKATRTEREEKSEPKPASKAATSREEKRRGRTCRVDGCDNYIVHKGLCCRHGGARKCTTEGCESTAKYMGLCWKHGGSTWCKVDGCTKRAKAKGRCWAHGGGTQCGHPECTKVAVSNGFCWAHGGGKRCLFDGCNRPGYERTNGFCDRHYEQMQTVDYFEV